MMCVGCDMYNCCLCYVCVSYSKWSRGWSCRGVKVLLIVIMMRWACTRCPMFGECMLWWDRLGDGARWLWNYDGTYDMMGSVCGQYPISYRMFVMYVMMLAQVCYVC